MIGFGLTSPPVAYFGQAASAYQESYGATAGESPKNELARVRRVPFESLLLGTVLLAPAGGILLALATTFSFAAYSVAIVPVMKRPGRSSRFDTPSLTSTGGNERVALPDRDSGSQGRKTRRVAVEVGHFFMPGRKTWPRGVLLVLVVVVSVQA